ncbi:hypothetical protein AVDCRST_MAG82-1729 [uncultured Rubrobacteraceae bacterium]|uniref:Uncharacterized protein n=1 Tax=uncultured Rubrobacteraceae bacterium TaxID=349277 RepID=A0A6J4PYN9_9ACTN|nr:hypothetical protein AVDCRST_MAG82-1729 [uncultured Rubrobacteraceae bacterium]
MNTYLTNALVDFLRQGDVQGNLQDAATVTE